MKRAGLTTAVIVLALVPSAHAWVVTRDGDRVIYSGDWGANNVTFSYTEIVDTSSPFDAADSQCAPGPDAYTAECSPPVGSVLIDLNEGADHLVINGASSGSPRERTDIRTGGGPDDIRGGGVNDEYYNLRNGQADHLDCDPPGQDGFEFVLADNNDVIAWNCDMVEYWPGLPPVSLTVTKTADTFDGVCDSDCSLRDALKRANAVGGTITVPPGDYPNASKFEIYGENEVTIRGPGARTTTIHGPLQVDGYDSDKPKRGTLTMSGVHLDGPLTVRGDGRAGITDSLLSARTEDGPVLSADGGTVVVRSSTIRESAIRSSGDLTLVNSTVTGNSSPGFSSAVSLTGSALIRHTTIAGAGNGALDAGPKVRVGDTIVTGGCSGKPYSLGNNDTSDSCGFTSPGDATADPLLGPLQDNGGPTDTMALLPGSPAIDAVSFGCVDEHGGPLLTDQRGVKRPQGRACDVGAYEAEPPPAAPPAEPLEPLQPLLPEPALAPAAPRIQSLTIRPRRFHAVDRATVRYLLSTTGTLSVRITSASGRKFGGARHIFAATTEGRFTLRGRANGRALRPGRYKLVALLTTTSGATSTVVRRSFEITH